MRDITEVRVQLNGQAEKLPLCRERRLSITTGTSVAGENQTGLAISAHNDTWRNGPTHHLKETERREVFNGELVSMKYITVMLSIKPDRKPTFLKAQPVPSGIRPKVEADLDALVNKNKVLEPVSMSEWLTPIVPVQGCNPVNGMM